jgi:hypothetical protein
MGEGMGDGMGDGMGEGMGEGMGVIRVPPPTLFVRTNFVTLSKLKRN